MMKINAKTAAVILPLFFFIGILTTMASGYWSTESSKQPARYEIGEFAGEYNPGDIRGSYSLQDLENAFGISVEVLSKAYGLADNENPGGLQVKVFEEHYGVIDDKEIGTDSMRLFVALYLGRPYAPEADTALPRPAFSILKKEGAASAEELAAFEDRVVSLENSGSVSYAGEDSHDEAALLTEIKGKTTFGELLDRGLEKEQIEEVLGMPAGARAVSVRDYCMEQGIEFSGIKAALQEVLNDL